MKPLRLLLSCLSLVVTQAHAASPASGVQWLDWLDSKEQFMKGVAYGYVAQVVEMPQLPGAQDVPPSVGRQFCIPTNVPVMQALDVAATEIRRHPKVQHLPATILIVAAFKAKWPCH